MSYVVWSPVIDALKEAPHFRAIGKDSPDGPEYEFWNGGGDWLREVPDEPCEDLCFPTLWRPL